MNQSNIGGRNFRNQTQLVEVDEYAHKTYENAQLQLLAVRTKDPLTIANANEEGVWEVGATVLFKYPDAKRVTVALTPAPKLRLGDKLSHPKASSDVNYREKLRELETSAIVDDWQRANPRAEMKTCRSGVCCKQL
jgi:hypothetical protein